MGWLSGNKDSADDAQTTSAKPGGVPGPAAPSAAPMPRTTSPVPGTSPVGRYGPLVHIPRFDVAPDELEWQLPINGELYRLMPGSDRPDYSLVVLTRPLHFYPKAGFDLARVTAEQRVEDRKGRPMVRVQALLVCARFVGQQLHPGMTDLPVNIAYVIDASLARDATVDFGKIEYAGVGFLTEGHGERARPAQAPAASAQSAPTQPAPTQPAPTPPAPTPPAPTPPAPTPPAPTPPVVDALPQPVADQPAEAVVDKAAEPEPEPEHDTAEPGPVEPEAAQPEPAERAPEPAPNSVPDSAPVGPVAHEDDRDMFAVMGQMLPRAIVALRSGIATNRGVPVQKLTATLTLDDSYRVIGLTGNADGSPPIPTPETFEVLNTEFAQLNGTPPGQEIRTLTFRVDGDQYNTDLTYRSEQLQPGKQ